MMMILIQKKKKNQKIVIDIIYIYINKVVFLDFFNNKNEIYNIIKFGN